MIIKCPRYKAAGCTEDHECMVDVEIPTADLIAELEKRRPKCEEGESIMTDNLTEYGLDKARMIEADAELVTDKIAPSTGIVGGMSAEFRIGTSTMWRQEVRLLIKAKPDWMPRWIYRIMFHAIEIGRASCRERV